MKGRRSLHGDRPDVGELPVEEDVRREVDAHIEMRTEELVARGWSREDARAEARRAFGDRRAVEEECREVTRSRDRSVRRAHFLDSLRQDLRFALRALRRSPGFAAVAILTLALGIGANTAVFSVVNGVLLRPLPYPAPDRLVHVSETNTRGNPMGVAWPNLQDWRERNRSFAGIAHYDSWNATLLGGEQPYRVAASPVTEDFWAVFPVTPVLGRLTVPEDHRADATPVMVIGHSFWRNRLGGDPDVVGRRFEAAGLTWEVVGVAPPDFRFPGEQDAWMPAEVLGPSDSRSAHNHHAVGRLRPGVAPASADRELDAITEEILADFPRDEYHAVGATVVSLHEQVAGDARRPLYLILGAAGLVLLVACTNLASTLLARGTVRAREVAVRASLGAGRGRLLRQLVTESLVLAALGAVAGVGVAAGVLRALVALGPDVPRLAEVGLDGAALSFAAGLTLLTAVLFGLLPSLRLTASGPGSGLREESRGGTDGAGRGLLWTSLVGGEVALAVVLLVGAGLLLRSFRAVLDQDPGIHAADVVATPLAPSRVEYGDPSAFVRLYDRVIQRVERRPGVETAAVTSVLPVAGFLPTGRLDLDGDLSRHADGAGYVLVSEDAFEALDVPLLQGRGFRPSDDASSPHVAVVSRSFAELHWPGEDPIGRSVSSGGMDILYEEPPFSTVVGVVDDVRYGGLTRETTPTVYFSFRQRPFRTQFGVTLLTEAADGSPSALVPAVRDDVRAVDPDIPVEPRLLEARLVDTVADRRFVLTAMGAFAAVGLLLALVGIYGVVSYTVARRTREMGIRMALGASPEGVLGLVVRHSMATVVVGLVVGTGAAVLLRRMMEGLLFGVEPLDPLTFGAVLALLAAAATAASWLPARRATRIDPMVTMRAE